MPYLPFGVSNPFPSPDVTLKPGLEPDQVTPGALGFFATFFMVVAVILLMRSMTARIRRVRYREQVTAREMVPAPDGHGPVPAEPAALQAEGGNPPVRSLPDEPHQDRVPGGDTDRESAGRAMYEERHTLLEGLWMPEAPPWNALPEDVKDRWRKYADKA